MRIPPQLVNYITAIFEDDKCDYTGIFKLAMQNGKIAKFIAAYPDLFEDIRTLMYQPRSASIHASAVLITPDGRDGENLECFDFVPIKKVDGMLISENDGVELDELGLLKNDYLATKELSKLQAVMGICNREYGVNLSLESVATSDLDNPSVYELLSQGYTQNVFQFSSRGMTKFLTEMKPICIDDLIAANALYRPATLENKATESYIDCKSGLVASTYLWGTHDVLKDTYGLIVYQEQVVQIVCKIGNFSLGDGVKLIKDISKKQVDKVHVMKNKFLSGAKQNGCPEEDANAIWKQIESCSSYLFNKSHATAYAVTSYVGAYLKVNYPTAFYTVALQWVNDDELITLMGEMEACSQAKVVPPDINVSNDIFYTDYQTNSIFWSLSRIKQLGTKSVQWIMNERSKNGKFSGITNFIDRVFKYKLKNYKYWDDADNEEETRRCPVTARHVLNLILAGCFDRIEQADSIIERYAIIERAAEHLGFEIKEKDFPVEMRDKHYFWSQQQIKVSGMGSINYRRIFDNSNIKSSIAGKVSYATLRDIVPLEAEDRKVAVCATVAETEERKFKNKKTGKTETFCKITLQQNNDLCECVVWPEEYMTYRGKLLDAKNKLIIFSAIVKYSDYESKNNLQFYKRSVMEVL
jgi:DNA polymerase-3 subunit alpha